MSDLPALGGSRLARERGGQAEEGALTVQRCRDCGRLQYPAGELCRYCLSDAVDWSRVRGSGVVLATGRVYASLHPFFREHAPWRICSVALDAGPRVIAHARDGEIQSGDRVDVFDERVGPDHCVLIARIAA